MVRKTRRRISRVKTTRRKATRNITKVEKTKLIRLAKENKKGNSPSPLTRFIGRLIILGVSLAIISAILRGVRKPKKKRRKRRKKDG